MTEMVDQTSVPTAHNPGGGPYTNAVCIGQRFTVSAACTIQSVSWCRMSAGDAAPTHVIIWNETDNTLAGSHPLTATDTGATGWHAENAGPWNLVTGKTYSVQRADPSGGRACGWTTAPPIPPAPYTVGGCYYNNNAGSSPGTLNGSQTGWELMAVSISTDPAAGGTGGTGGTGASDADLAAWLSTDATVNTHHTDSAPYKTEALATGATGFDAIKAVADAIAAAVGGLAGTVAGAVTTITGQITSSTADIFDHAVTGLVAISGDIRSVENHALDVLAGIVTFPGASDHWQWVAGDPIGFEECVVCAVAAEAYHLEILDSGRVPLNITCGVHILYRVGWWCELAGGIGSERHFIDFEETLLRAGSRRLSGCLVVLQPGCTGVLTPYTLEAV